MNSNIKSYMHVGLVLDASGSMSSLRSTTIESLKKFFDGLRSAEDRTLLDVWQFDSEVKHLVDAADINAGAPETLENYTTGGCTALYDAICTGIDHRFGDFADMLYIRGQLDDQKRLPHRDTLTDRSDIRCRRFGIAANGCTEACLRVGAGKIQF